MCFEIAQKKVVFQQNMALLRLVPGLNLDLSLRVIWRTTLVIHAFALNPYAKSSEA
tara:strand:+ start:511 stop:678 length:168 start_codon:yes stop_codon:yes gene_type:complete